MSKRNKEDHKELFNKLSKNFHEIVSDKRTLRSATERFLNNIIDDLTLGIIFDAHRHVKTNGYDLEGNEDNICELEPSSDFTALAEGPNMTADCPCPICKKEVSYNRYCKHLQDCMGLGRKGRNVASASYKNSTGKEKDTTYSDNDSEEHDDDEDWNPRDKRRKRKKEKNGKKKFKGTPKKYDTKLGTDSPIDIEGEDEDILNLHDFLRADHSNSSSPAESTCSNLSSHSSSSRKKDKSGKKSRRNLSSPTSSVSSLD